MISIKKAMFAVVIIALAMFALPSGTAYASTASDEDAFVRDINALRASQGLPALAVESHLTSIARSFAAQMAANGSIFHNPNLASSAPSQWLKLGENVGVGYDEPSLHQAFVNSPAHYRNLVDPSYRYIGLGVVYSGGKTWVVEDFMQTSTPIAAAPVLDHKAEKIKEFVDTMAPKTDMPLKARIAVGQG
jgi:uncharacterized protein YkwD